jgi:hypothetical protein
MNAYTQLADTRIAEMRSQAARHRMVQTARRARRAEQRTAVQPTAVQRTAVQPTAGLVTVLRRALSALLPPGAQRQGLGAAAPQLPCEPSA